MGLFKDTHGVSVFGTFLRSIVPGAAQFKTIADESETHQSELNLLGKQKEQAQAGIESEQSKAAAAQSKSIFMWVAIGGIVIIIIGGAIYFIKKLKKPATAAVKK